MSSKITMIKTDKNLTSKKAIELSFENLVSLTPSKNSFHIHSFSRSIEGNEDLYVAIDRTKITHKEVIKRKHNHKERIDPVEETSNLLSSFNTERLVNKNDSNRNLM